MIVYNSKLIKFINLFKKKSQTRGLTLWPFIYIRDSEASPVLLQHENIHLRQQEELFVIGFYFLYIWYHFSRGYNENPFECEARGKQVVVGYLRNRKKMAWKAYV